MYNDMKCEICGNDDAPCMVVSSSLGAFSQNTCIVCGSMSAVPYEFIKVFIEDGLIDGEFVYYVAEDDNYHLYSTGELLPIQTEAADIYENRKAYINAIGKHFHKFEGYSK